MTQGNDTLKVTIYTTLGAVTTHDYPLYEAEAEPKQELPTETSLKKRRDELVGTLLDAMTNRNAVLTLIRPFVLYRTDSLVAIKVEGEMVDEWAVSPKADVQPIGFRTADQDEKVGG